MRRSPFLALVAVAVVAAPISADRLPADASVAVATDPLPAWTARDLAGFGSAVALDGEHLLIGNPDEFPFFPMPPASLGNVHVFEAGPGGWVEIDALSWSEGSVADGFGRAISVGGDRLAVGAPGADGGRGAVVLFRREGDRWIEDGSVRLSDAAAGSGFGQALAWAGETLLVGAPGHGGNVGLVTAFSAADGWTESARFSPESPVEGGRFGTFLSTRGERLLATAPGAGVEAFQGAGGFQPGVGYVFATTAGGWAQQATLAVGGDVPAGLGLSGVLLEGEVLLGAPIAAGAGGAIHRFTEDGMGAWTHVGVVPVEPFEAPQALLGMAMAAAGDDVLVGAPFVNAVVVLSRTDQGWMEAQRLVLPGGGQDFFGIALAASDDRAIVGAPGAAIFAGLGEMVERGADGWTLAGPIAERLREGELIAPEEPVTCTEGTAAGFGCANVDLAAFVPLSALGAERGVMVNDVWGWTDPETGHEWALVGRTDGMAFVDVTRAAAPFYAGELLLSEGAVSNIWRDVKVYADHAFVVADGAGDHGMQVFDLTRLRDVTGAEAPVTFDADGHYAGIASAHNIVINEESGFGYAVGAAMGGTTCGGGLHMIDLRDPKNPSFAGCFQDPNTGTAGTGYSHDAQCITYRGPDDDWTGREICFGANENALSIADVTDKDAPVAIAAARYPNSAYLHQGWVSEDQRWFFMNDELDELSGIAPRTRTLVWDIEDLDDPVLVTEHLGTTSASDHNLYVAGDLMYQSNYVSGLRVLDVSDPENPIEVGFFDTVTSGDDAPGFAGSWSNYPFFESGTVIVTSMREGLFLLKVRPRSTVF
jgi:choice-of-anchor B domain-containing protein